MLLVTSNKRKKLLNIRFMGRVVLKDFQNAREDMIAELGALPQGFRYLADFSQLESMGLDCVPEIGKIMELIEKAGASLTVRFIPDPSKDIGMNILTAFHYSKRLKVVTCQHLKNVVKTLGL